VRLDAAAGRQAQPVVERADGDLHAQRRGIGRLGLGHGVVEPLAGAGGEGLTGLGAFGRRLLGEGAECGAGREQQRAGGEMECGDGHGLLRDVQGRKCGTRAPRPTAPRPAL